MPRSDERTASRLADQLLLAAYAPDAVVVDADDRVVHVRGDAKLFLRQDRRSSARALAAVLEDALVEHAVSVLRRVRDGAPVAEATAHVRVADVSRAIRLRATRLEERGAGHVLMVFDPTPEVDDAAAPSRASVRAPREDDRDALVAENARLRAEVAGLRTQLRGQRIAHDAALEEIRSQNEEHVSANEELAAANEELALSRATIESTNAALGDANAELRRSNAELRQLTDDLESVLRSVDLPVVILSNARRIWRFTSGAAEAYGLLPGDLGRPLSDLRLGLDVEDLDGHVARVLSTLEPLELEARDRSGRWWLVRVRPYRAADGRVDGAVLAALDIDERRRAREERDALLRDREEQLLLADRRKDEFLAVVSHELRTPVTAMVLWSRLLRAGTVPASQWPTVFEAMEASSLAQQRLIEDLLDVSRITRGTLRLQPRDADLGALVTTAVDSVRSTAVAKGVELETTIDGALGPVRVDPDRIRQVAANLISNAVKFTPKGGRVSVAVHGSDERVILRVADTGRGIDAALLPHVFDRFRQADATPRRLQGGLGLGLAIARELVALHGGTIHAESPGEGRGSTFTVALPWTTGPSTSTETRATPATFHPSSKLAGLRVLLVEDDSLSRDALRWVLERCEAEVTAVASADDASRAFRAARRRRAFHAIVSDIAMPGRDGHDLIEEIRRLEGRGKSRVPAAALTAFASDADAARARSGVRRAPGEADRSDGARRRGGDSGRTPMSPPRLKLLANQPGDLGVSRAGAANHARALPPARGLAQPRRGFGATSGATDAR